MNFKWVIYYSIPRGWRKIRVNSKSSTSVYVFGPSQGIVSSYSSKPPLISAMECGHLEGVPRCPQVLGNLLTIVAVATDWHDRPSAGWVWAAKLMAQYLQLEGCSMFHFHHDGRDSTKNPSVQVRWMWWYRDLWNQKTQCKMKCFSNTSPRHQNVTSKKNPPKPWLFENSGDNGLTRVACRMKNGGGQSAAVFPDRRGSLPLCPWNGKRGGLCDWSKRGRGGGLNLLPPL